MVPNMTCVCVCVVYVCVWVCVVGGSCAFVCFGHIQLILCMCSPMAKQKNWIRPMLISMPIVYSSSNACAGHMATKFGRLPWGFCFVTVKGEAQVEIYRIDVVNK